VFGLSLEFRVEFVSNMTLFDTHPRLHTFPEQEGYGVVSKLISKSKFQNLTNPMSFDTIVICANPAD
jgi:hypothetical protein